MTTDATSPVRRASVGARVGGILIDWMLSMVISSFFFASPEFADSTGVQRVLLAGQPLATLGIWAVQHWVLVALLGTTYGHRLFGLRAVRDDDGGHPGFARAGIRTLLLALVIPAVVWDAQGRGLHDRAARTRLMSVR